MQDHLAQRRDKPLTVQFVDTQTHVPSQLWDACFSPPLEGRWWYAMLESSGLEDQFTFFYAVIWDGNRAVGVAPGFHMRLPLSVVIPDALLSVAAKIESIHPSLLRPSAMFVGSPCSDEGTVGLLPGTDREAALLCLQQALRARMAALKIPILVWKDFPEAYTQTLHWLSARSGLFRAESYPGTIVRLPGSKEAYLESLSSSRRQRYKRMLRRSGERLQIDVSVVERPEATTLDEIFGLFWQAYEHGRTKFEVLNQTFFEKAALHRESRFVLLRDKCTGKLVAFTLCFVLGDRVINKFVGIDCTRPRNLFLKARLWDAVIDWALAIGASSIQSGQTGYATKLMTGHTLVPLSNFCLHRNPIMHAVFRFVGTRIRWQGLDPELSAALLAHPELEPRQDQGRIRKSSEILMLPIKVVRLWMTRVVTSKLFQSSSALPIAQVEEEAMVGKLQDDNSLHFDHRST